MFKKKKKKHSERSGLEYINLGIEGNTPYESPSLSLSLKQKEAGWGVEGGEGGEGTLPSCPELSRYSVRSQPKALAAPFRFSFCLAPLFFMS